MLVPLLVYYDPEKYQIGKVFKKTIKKSLIETLKHINKEKEQELLLLSL